MKSNPDFELKDLKGLYKPTILIRDHHLSDHGGTPPRSP